MPTGGLDLPRTVMSGQVFRWSETEPGIWSGVDGDNRYRVRWDEGQILVESNAESAEFSRLFGLDDDPWGDVLAADPALTDLRSRQSGLVLMLPSCPRETFFSFVCTANNHLTRIRPMVLHLASLGQGTRFPTLDRLANCSEAELRQAGFGYRAPRIPFAARTILDRGGDEYLCQLKLATYAEAHRELLSISGIGPKLADCVALYGLHHMEAVPVDTHLWQTVTSRFLPDLSGTSLTPQRHRLVGEFLRDRFGRRAGFVQLLLYYDHLESAKRFRK